MKIGLDMGTHNVNTSEMVSFSSKISYDSFQDTNLVIYNDKKYYVGEGDFIPEWDKTSRENLMLMIFTALARSSDSNNFDVVLGLPIGQYKEKKDELIKKIKENNTANIYVNGNLRNVTINNVDVAPEGASVYYNLSSKQYEQIKGHKLVVVDIGGRTTDICSISNGNIMDYKSLDTGLLKIYGDIVKEVNRRYTESFPLEKGEDLLKHGLLLDGEKKDITDIRQDSLKRSFGKIFSTLELDFNVRDGYLLLTGGGSIVLKKPFKNRLNNIIFSNNAYFDNALAFKKIAVRKWGCL